jgi:deoxycytidine triphosphate deaminase
LLIFSINKPANRPPFMILNSTDIRSHNLIDPLNFEQKSLKEISYNIRIGSINIGDKDFIETDWNIDVNGLVVVISKEKITLPNDVVGYAHIKTSFSQEGLLAINTGIIDPGYEGHLSTVLINYGRKPHKIKINDEVLRLTFHKINHNPQTLPATGYKFRNLQEYTNSIFRASSNLSKTFINEEKIIQESNKRATRSVWQIIIAAGIVVTMIAAIFGYVQNIRLNNNQYDDFLGRLKLQNETIELQLKYIKEQNKKIDSLHTIVNGKSFTKSTNASHKRK